MDLVDLVEHRDDLQVRGDLQMTLLPLRLLRLAQLLREGDAEGVAFHAFYAGMHWGRVETVLQEPEIQKLRDLKGKWANRRGKGADPAAVRKAVELLVRDKPRIRAKEAYRKVGEKFNLKPGTVRKLASFKSLKRGVSGGAKRR
jgi:hypothetical protein